MRRAIITLLVLLSFGLKAQVYQAMPQAGYGPVKRMLFDSVLTIPLNINQLRNITGGRDAGQIRYNVTDSGLYVFSGFQWIKANLDSTNISNRINGKLNISDTAQMLSVYMKYLDTLSLSNRINLRVKYSDTAQMLSVYLRKLDTASLSDRINKKQDSIILTTNFKSGAATLVGATLNIPKYSDTLQDNYVPYVGANKDVDLGVYKLNANTLQSDYLLQVKNSPTSIAPTKDYTAITGMESGLVLYSSWMTGNTTYTQQNFINYANTNLQNNTRQYNLPVRDGTLALVEDTVNLSNRINLKADKATVLTINGVGYDLSANRTWTIPTFDSTSISNRINLKLNISDTASMLSPYLRKADTSSLSNRIDLKLNISDTASMLSPYLKSAVTSVGLSMPNAFSVANSPITSTGTIAVTGAGTAAQYIRGDGQLATLPSGASGGSSVNYYLNGSVNQGTIGGSVYYEMSKTPVIGAGTDFALAGNGLISQFITDVADPNRLQIPAGNWNFEIYMSASSSGGTPKFYVELLKYDGTNFTSIASSSANPEAITNGTTIDLYLTALAIPQTTLLATDRLAIRVYIVNSTGGRTITMHTENSHLCEIITNFAGGVSALNGLTANTQYLAVGTSGNDFAINSLTDTHTFNLPTASSTKRGALSSTDWSTFNGKMNYSDTVSLSNRINLKLNSSDTISLSNRINTKLNATDTASLSNRINAKADALSGTTNTVPKFTSGTTIGNSNIKDDGNAVSISTTAGSNGALQVGNYNGNILMNTTNTNAGLIFKNTSSSNKLWDISSFNNDLNFNESNISPTVMTLKAGGDVLISSLIGSGTRMVVASSTGVLSTQSITGVDTTSLSNRINLKLNISDTASMLSGYQSAINSKQAQINGTGFVKASGTTISYDNSTYYLASNPNGYTSNTGTVTSVASGLGLSGGTITTSGTLLVDTASASILSRQRAANTYYLASNPNGYTSNTGTVTSVATGLGLSGGTISTSGTLLVDTSSASILSRQRAANTYATTSSLSGYLPLTGGTLTGALGGTSASFTGALTLNGSSGFPSTGLLNRTSDATLYMVAASSGFTLTDASLNTMYSATPTSHSFNISNVPKLTIASTGAATFSSSVTGTKFISTTNSSSISRDINSSYLQILGGNDFSSGQAGINIFGKTDVTNAGGIDLYADNFSVYNSTSPYGFKFKITSAGNVGIGTTPSAWGSTQRVLEIGGPENGYLAFNPANLQSFIYWNAYFDTDNRYKKSSQNAAAFGVTSTGSYAWYTAPSGTAGNSIPFTQAMTLTNGGNVGIGTTSPLSISGFTSLEVKGTTAGLVAVSSGNGTAFGRMYNGGSTVIVGTSTAHPLIFDTNDSEKMRITSGGSVGIGNTNPFGLASSLVAISGSGSTYNLLNIQETVNASNAAFVQFMNSGGSTIGSITRVGTTNAVLFNTSSDIRLKKDLGVANKNIIDSVVIHDFEWLQNSLVDKGVFAQELYKIKPLAVSVGKDEVNKDGELLKPWGVDYSKLIPDLIIYCQDLKKTIKELQTEIQTLKNK